MLRIRMLFQSWSGIGLTGNVTNRVPNSPTGQVLGVGPDFSVQVNVNDWT